jgi:tetratricopeptide (TPR) repeat protein
MGKPENSDILIGIESFVRGAAPDSPEATWFNRGLVAYRTSALQLATSAFKNSLRASDRFETWFNLAMCQKKEENWQDAIESFKHVVRIEPRFREAYEELAELYERTDEFEMAEQCRQHLKRL